jgi:hypothetical protein
MEKKQIILPTRKYENAPSEELQVRIGLDEEKSILRIDDRDIILDLSEQFKTERDECLRYKIYGKIKMIFRNLYLGTSPYDYLENKLALEGNGEDLDFSGYLPYDEFAFLRKDVFREITNDVSIDSLLGFTGFSITTTGDTLHQKITPITAPYHNWNIYLSHVYSHTKTFPMKYTLSGATKTEGSNLLTFTSGDGIPFRVSSTVNLYKLTSPIKHGMSQGEYIIINSTPYYISSVGDEYYDSQNYVLNLYKTQFLTGVTLNQLVIGKRCTNINNITGSTSEYYVHKHRILTSTNDYILDKVGFESLIFEEERKLLFQNKNGDVDPLVERNRMESVLFDFKVPVTLTGITNNLNYTPTEVYVTTLFRNGNGYFNYPPKVGYSFHIHDYWIDDHFIGTGTTESGMTSTPMIVSGITFYTGNTLTKGDVVTGAFVEYDPVQMKERIISESFHKIISNQLVFDHDQSSNIEYPGSTSNNPIGLYYQPHYRVKIRELSPYVETSDTNDILFLPDNARFFPSEKLWKWRDVYDIGYVDVDGFGVDYPFMNNTHYIQNDINFYLRNEKAFTTKKDGIINFNLTNDKNKNGGKTNPNC